MFSCCQQNSSSPKTEYLTILPPQTPTPRLLNPIPTAPQLPSTRKGITHHLGGHRSHRNKGTQTSSLNSQSSGQLGKHIATQTTQPEVGHVLAEPRETLTTHYQPYLGKYSNIKTSLWNSKQPDDYLPTQRTVHESNPYLALPPPLSHSFTLPVPPPLPPLLRSLPASQPTNEPLTTISNLFRDVVSEVKHEPTDEKQPRMTPHRRHLFPERDTIMSHYDEDSANQQSVRVEESAICQPEENFIQNGETLWGGQWILYQAVSSLGQQVSVKEMPVTEMAEIARQVELSRQIDDIGASDLILRLQGSQINQGRYLLVMEEFTCSLATCLKAGASLEAMTLKLTLLLESLWERGYSLSTTPQLVDFVVRGDRIVLANMGVAGQGPEEFCGREEAVLLLRQQMLQQLI